MTTKSNRKNVKVLKEHVINVRCTTEQAEIMKATAVRKGLGVSTWLLYLGLEASAATNVVDR